MKKVETMNQYVQYNNIFKWVYIHTENFLNVCAKNVNRGYLCVQ